MKVAMIGCGKLGLPCAEVMANYHSVVGYDLKPFQSKTVSQANTIIEAIENAEIIFIAVPTPHSSEYGGEHPTSELQPKDFDYSIVETVLKEIAELANENQLIVLISTVLPGTTRARFSKYIEQKRFIYNPYLIAMGSVKWDMQNPECLIIGTKAGSSDRDSEKLLEFYKDMILNNARVNLGTWDEAECIKIFYNTYISMKVSFVNMIQDVSMANGNINVDVVTDALKAAGQRVTGPKYLTAGMGDAGACHPRDNIALSWIAKKLNLGYDFFKAIMFSREQQAKNLADFLIKLSDENSIPIAIHGKAYKPLVEYTDGSYSLLIEHFVRRANKNIIYIDPLTGDDNELRIPHVVLMAHSSKVTYSGTGIKSSEIDLYCEIPKGSIVVDPWRQFPSTEGLMVIHYGNTRTNINK